MKIAVADMNLEGLQETGKEVAAIVGEQNVLVVPTEDEILDEEAIRASPSQVGVIGSRPPAAKKSLAKSLNPAAPTFMTNLFTKTAKSEKVFYLYLRTINTSSYDIVRDHLHIWSYLTERSQ